MGPQLLRLIEMLADGELHSGEKLSATMGVSRAAVWKQLKKLEVYGLEVIAERSRGYRLSHGLDLLDEHKLQQCLINAGSAAGNVLEVKSVTGSTNADALAKVAETASPAVVTTEYQATGRGRRGKQWVSPYGANIYLSLAWPYFGNIGDIAGLSLAVGVVAAGVLEKHGVADVQLKWPNDLYVQGQKLGGILIEMQGEPNDGLSVVVGLGINVQMPKTSSDQIDQAWTDVASHVARPNRQKLVQDLVIALYSMWQSYGDKGFAAYTGDWERLDFLAGKTVCVEIGDDPVFGIAQGVNEDGAFLLRDQSGELKTFYGGEVSLRPV